MVKSARETTSSSDSKNSDNLATFEKYAEVLDQLSKGKYVTRDGEVITRETVGVLMDFIKTEEDKVQATGRPSRYTPNGSSLPALFNALYNAEQVLIASDRLEEKLKTNEKPLADLATLLPELEEIYSTPAGDAFLKKFPVLRRATTPRAAEKPTHDAIIKTQEDMKAHLGKTQETLRSFLLDEKIFSQNPSLLAAALPQRNHYKKSGEPFTPEVLSTALKVLAKQFDKIDPAREEAKTSLRIQIFEAKNQGKTDECTHLVELYKQQYGLEHAYKNYKQAKFEAKLADKAAITAKSAREALISDVAHASADHRRAQEKSSHDKSILGTFARHFRTLIQLTKNFSSKKTRGG